MWKILLRWESLIFLWDRWLGIASGVTHFSGWVWLKRLIGLLCWDTLPSVKTPRGTASALSDTYSGTLLRVGCRDNNASVVGMASIVIRPKPMQAGGYSTRLVKAKRISWLADLLRWNFKRELFNLLSERASAIILAAVWQPAETSDAKDAENVCSSSEHTRLGDVCNIQLLRLDMLRFSHHAGSS